MYRNSFYFIQGNERYSATALDLRPHSKPKGWMLFIDNSLAEYGVAHSDVAAVLHVETAKSRYVRKTFYEGKYMAELSPKDRQAVNVFVKDGAWKVLFLDVRCNVRPNLLWRDSMPDAERILGRDIRRLKRLGLTVPK